MHVEGRFWIFEVCGLPLSMVWKAFELARQEGKGHLGAPQGPSISAMPGSGSTQALGNGTMSIGGDLFFFSFFSSFSLFRFFPVEKVRQRER